MKLSTLSAGVLLMAACVHRPPTSLPPSKTTFFGQGGTLPAGTAVDKTDMLIIRLDGFPGPGGVCGMDHTDPHSIDDDLLVKVSVTGKELVLVKYSDPANTAGSTLRVPWSVLPDKPGQYWLEVIVYNRGDMGHASYRAWLPHNACTFVEHNEFKCNTGSDFSWGYWFAGCGYDQPFYYETNRIRIDRP